MKMKNITKIIIAALLAMCLVAWGSPAEARGDHNRSGRSKVYKKANRSHYQRVYRNQRFNGYHHNYPKHPYYRYGYKYKPNLYRYGYNYRPNYYGHDHYSLFGLWVSPYRTRIHIRFGF
jgi:hypothetical protein